MAYKALERTRKTRLASYMLLECPPDTWVGEKPIYNYLDLDPNFLLLVNIKYFSVLIYNEIMDYFVLLKKNCSPF